MLASEAAFWTYQKLNQHTRLILQNAPTCEVQLVDEEFECSTPEAVRIRIVKILDFDFNGTFVYDGDIHHLGSWVQSHDVEVQEATGTADNVRKLEWEPKKTRTVYTRVR